MVRSSPCRERAGQLTIAGTVAARSWQQFTKPPPGLVQLGFGVLYRAPHALRALVAFVPLDVVKNKHLFVSVRQLVDDPFQVNAVNYATQAEVRSAYLQKRFGVLIAGLGSLIKRYLGMLLLANSHEHNVDGQPVQPGGKA